MENTRRKSVSIIASLITAAITALLMALLLTLHEVSTDTSCCSDFMAGGTVSPFEYYLTILILLFAIPKGVFAVVVSSLVVFMITRFIKLNIAVIITLVLMIGSLAAYFASMLLLNT